MILPRKIPTLLIALALLGGVFQSLSAAPITGLKVFGDSLSDQGNTHVFFPLPAPYDNGRFSNGPVWVEYLNSSLGLSLLERNGVGSPTGSNFAYGGSTSGPETAVNALPTLLDQVGSYLAIEEAGPSPTIGTDLFILWSGGNDVINRVEGASTGDPLAGVANISLAMTNLYNAGARQFLIPNLPALGFKPDFLGTPMEGLANGWVDDFNESLSLELDGLETLLEGSVIFRLDVHGLVNDILADPSLYDFTNVTQGAIGVPGADPSEYLFWDDTHPTTAGHQLIAAQAMAAIPEPSTFLLVGIGVATMVTGAGLRKRAGN